eukprot:gnl/TRDRNA2_/TRDRNA2_127864_c2_seq1.p1 gnl/TRDRNA2_/TRDRNA2_127864_c2~~gnl/TRDRNA2_/TRDRNA2_127864_c2_seq1.p1  ORF type:complete len:163 (-),score=22.35 gnl/TRDRNA2_/TRDRNA2_127864_c2_seq1:123-584(-)
MLLDHHRFGAIDANMIPVKGKRTGGSAFHVACFFGHIEVSRVFLDHERFGMVNAQLPKPGGTALHVAASEDHAEVCQLLLDHPRFQSARVALSFGNFGWTALHTAAFVGAANSCEVLLSHEGCGTIKERTMICKDALKQANEKARKVLLRFCS